MATATFITFTVYCIPFISTESTYINTCVSIYGNLTTFIEIYIYIHMICTPPIPIPILIYETPLGHPFASPFPTDSSSWSLSSDRFSKRLDTCTTLRRSRDQRRSLLFRGTFSWLDGKLLCCENFGSLYRKQHECLNRARFLEYFKNNWGLRGIG